MLDIKDKIISWCTAADVSGFVSAVRHPVLAQKSVEVFDLLKNMCDCEWFPLDDQVCSFQSSLFDLDNAEALAAELKTRIDEVFEVSVLDIEADFYVKVSVSDDDLKTFELSE